MFDIEIKLIIASINYEDGKKYILSSVVNKFELPTHIVNENTDIEEELASLFNKYTGFDIGWSECRLITVELDQKILKLYYLSKIIYDTPINGNWISFLTAAAIDPVLQRCVLYV